MLSKLSELENRFEELNQAWAEAEHQANVYYHDTGD